MADHRDRVYGEVRDGCVTCGEGERCGMTLEQYLDLFDVGEPAGDLARHTVELIEENEQLQAQLLQRVELLEPQLVKKIQELSAELFGLRDVKRENAWLNLENSRLLKAAAEQRAINKPAPERDSYEYPGVSPKLTEVLDDAQRRAKDGAPWPTARPSTPEEEYRHD